MNNLILDAHLVSAFQDSSSESHSEPTSNESHTASLPVTALIGVGLKSSKANKAGKPGIKNQDIIVMPTSHVVVTGKAVESARRVPTQSQERGASPKNNAHRANEPTGAALKHKPTMLRRLASKLRLPNPAPQSTSAGAPGLTNSFVSKEHRDAALRERGLLPPLPLSVQEHQQDRELGVQPLPPSESSEEMTMAKKIKQEWEAKNREQAKADSPPAQLDRMKSFRFGGPTSQSSSSLKEPAPAPGDTEPVPEVDSPTLPPTDIPSSSHSTSSPPPPPVKTEPATPPRTHSKAESASSPIRQSTSSSIDKELPSPPAKDTSASNPSSPTSAKFSVPPSPRSLSYTTPLPPSMPPTPSSGSGSGSRTPKQNPTPQSPSKASAFRIDTASPNTLSPPASPMSTRSTNLTPSSSGCTDESSASQSLAPTPVSTGSQARPSSFASSSSPSLDSSSQATSTSASSYGSSKGLGIRPAGAGHALIPGLSVRAPEPGIPSIPVIVESPVEEAMVLPSMTLNQDHMYLNATGKEAIKSAVTVTLPDEPSAKSSPPLPPPPPPAAVPRLRAPTSNKKGDRRKSLGIFKRDDDANGVPTKRISVSASFGNLRRSVVGTINSSGSSSSTRQSTYSGDSSLSSFDATHLPPSPTLPASFSSGTSAGGLPSSSSAPTRLRPHKNHGPPPVSVRPRQALSPTMHSRGSILIEAGSIEDDESRRLSEMAFLT